MIIDWDALRAELGTATLDYEHEISAADARRLACECKLIPVVLGADSEPLDVGRAARTVPPGIRRALVARDRGCMFPGCHRPPQRCAAHHVRHWADGDRDVVFISYSHDDAQWAQRLRVLLKPLVRRKRLRLWNDTAVTWSPDGTRLTTASDEGKICIFDIDCPDALTYLQVEPLTCLDWTSAGIAVGGPYGVNVLDLVCT